MLASEPKSSPKYLVVDDEIVRKRQKEAFIKPTALPIEAGIFVETYDEALQVLKSNSNIVLCFVDLRIPLNKQEKYEKDDGESKNWIEQAQEIIELKNEYGVKLLEQIRNIDTYIFSAYAQESLLKRVADIYKVVRGCFEKPGIPETIQEEIKPYLGLFSQEKAVSPLTKSFDYSSLDEETSFFVRSRTVEIKKLAKRATEDIMDIGNYIIEVKDKLEYGNFYRWLEAEFSWSIRTAARFMSVAQRFNSDILSEVDLLPTALYTLAPLSVPEEAVAEAIERARQGEIITEKKAKAIKAKYKALKEKVEPQNIEQLESSQNRERVITVPCVSEPSPSLPEKDRPKQEILGVVPSQNAVQNSWWQLGSHNRLFCGEPKSQEFFKNLPKDIALDISFLPRKDFSLIPPIESNSTLTFHSKYEDLDLDSLIEDYINTATRGKDLVVFNYLYYVGLLNLTESLNCYFWVAEPDLKKCERILTIWREKGSVMRIA